MGLRAFAIVWVICATVYFQLTFCKKKCLDSYGDVDIFMESYKTLFVRPNSGALTAIWTVQQNTQVSFYFALGINGNVLFHLEKNKTTWHCMYGTLLCKGKVRDPTPV